MNEIDWSTAPDGCIGAFTSKHDFISVGFSPFFVITKRYSDYGAQEGCSGEDQDGKEYHLFEKNWDYHEKPASWSGEGLPPVGTVLEAIDKEFKGGTWTKVVVLAVGKHGKDDCLMVAEVIEGQSSPGEMMASLYTGWERSFRPIRTPEQIAADEREAAIDEMLAATPAPGSDISLRVCEKLYDAGYRKP